MKYTVPAVYQNVVDDDWDGDIVKIFQGWRNIFKYFLLLTVSEFVQSPDT